ncbi:hypothetical protein [Paenibacillus massiliensis]|nr:hypothetical protein [Paenibacillus massiliensis]
MFKNVELIGQETPKRCLKRWWKIYDSSGEVGLPEERREKVSTGKFAV